MSHLYDGELPGVKREQIYLPAKAGIQRAFGLLDDLVYVTDLPRLLLDVSLAGYVPTLLSFRIAALPQSQLSEAIRLSGGQVIQYRKGANAAAAVLLNSAFERSAVIRSRHTHTLLQMVGAHLFDTGTKACTRPIGLPILVPSWLRIMQQFEQRLVLSARPDGSRWMLSAEARGRWGLQSMPLLEEAYPDAFLCRMLGMALGAFHLPISQQEHFCVSQAGTSTLAASFFCKQVAESKSSRTM